MAFVNTVSSSLLYTTGRRLLHTTGRLLKRPSSIEVTHDLVFAKLFAVERNKSLTKSLINAILKSQYKTEDIEIRNPRNVPEAYGCKESILDVKVDACVGHGYDRKVHKKLNIEVRIVRGRDYEKRAMFYLSKMYSDQLPSAADYNQLVPSISIHILRDFSILGNKFPRYHNRFILKEDHSNLLFPNETIELHIIELLKFSNEISEKLDAWANFLLRSDSFNPKEVPENILEPEMIMALEELGKMKFTPEEAEAYESRLKWIRLNRCIMRDIKEQDEELRQARAEGRVERVRAMAQSMLEEGMPKETVERITGISCEELETIKRGS